MSQLRKLAPSEFEQKFGAPPNVVVPGKMHEHVVHNGVSWARVIAPPTLFGRPIKMAAAAIIDTTSMTVLKARNDQVYDKLPDDAAELPLAEPYFWFDRSNVEAWSLSTEDWWLGRHHVETLRRSRWTIPEFDSNNPSRKCGVALVRNRSSTGTFYEVVVENDREKCGPRSVLHRGTDARHAGELYRMVVAIKF
ncbi:MAG: hypothetical protein ACN6OP_25585 [Pseudomonadales bacterium]